MDKKYTLGIDVGGTKIIGTCLDEDNQKIAIVKKNTKAFEGMDSAIKRLISTIKQLITESKISTQQVLCIGLGVPGLVDQEKGIVLTAPNLKWNNVNLREILHKEFNTYIHIENDVNAGLFAEYAITLERKYKYVVGLFVGTGIGGGIILDGKLFRGASGFAGEIGHMIVKTGGKICSCGNSGCLETVASKTGLMQTFKKDLSTNDLWEIKDYILQDENYVLKSSHLKKILKEGNPYVEKQLKKMASKIAVGISNIANLLNPQVVVLGGGVFESIGPFLMKHILKKLKKMKFQICLNDIIIKEAVLGDDSVMIGAALLAREVLHPK